jgi:hypothetical protein
LGSSRVKVCLGEWTKSSRQPFDQIPRPRLKEAHDGIQRKGVRIGIEGSSLHLNALIFRPAGASLNRSTALGRSAVVAPIVAITAGLIGKHLFNAYGPLMLRAVARRVGRQPAAAQTVSYRLMVRLFLRDSTDPRVPRTLLPRTTVVADYLLLRYHRSEFTNTGSRLPDMIASDPNARPACRPLVVVKQRVFPNSPTS